MEWKSFSENSACVKLDSSKLMKEIESLDDDEKILFEAKKNEREFIKNLINRRKSMGLTQTELSRRTGLSQQVISNIEKFGRKPTLTNLIRYLSGLGLDLNSLFKADFN